MIFCDISVEDRLQGNHLFCNGPQVSPPGMIPNLSVNILMKISTASRSTLIPMTMSQSHTAGLQPRQKVSEARLPMTPHGKLLIGSPA